MTAAIDPPSQPNINRVHVWISGRVQGVYYRVSTQQVATELGLSGWVKNLYDGRVEAVFEGDLQKIEQMLAWCHQGPKRAIVQDVDIEHEAPQFLKGFQVLDD